MEARRVTGACLSLLFASAGAFAQQPADPADAGRQRISERTYLRGGLAPERTPSGASRPCLQQRNSALVDAVPPVGGPTEPGLSDRIDVVRPKG